MDNNKFAPYEKHEYKSTQTNELFAALAKAQSEMENANPETSNTFFKSKYADLAAIIKASRPALTKHGLSIAQPIIMEDGFPILITVLAHASGQWIESRIKINPPKTDIQAFGSCVTYLRRYCIAALCGIAAGENDDDGETHMQQERKQPNVQYITAAQVNTLKEKVSADPKHKEKYGTRDWSKCTQENYEGWLAYFEKA
jgi:hypothetical protein